jgi:hypothetical protein
MTNAPRRRGEEVACSLSHGVGFMVAVAATPILIIGAVKRGGTADVVGGSDDDAALSHLRVVSRGA